MSHDPFRRSTSNPAHEENPEPGLTSDGEAQPPVDEEFRQLRKIGLSGGRMMLYDSESKDTLWIKTDDCPYLVDKR